MIVFVVVDNRCSSFQTSFVELCTIVVILVKVYSGIVSLHV